MSTKKRFFLTITFISIVCVTACRKSKDDSDDPSFEFLKGFGRSVERPEGLPFTWPKGIRLLDKPGTGDECIDAIHNLKRNYGHGGQVGLCLNLYNETDKSINLKLPPGLMFISKSDKVQNGLLITTVSIEVPPQQRYLAYLHMICVNPPRSNSAGYEYEEQPIVTDHPALRGLVKMLENKKCNYEDYGGAFPNSTAQKVSGVISVAVQDLIYGRPIHDQELTDIGQMANR